MGPTTITEHGPSRRTSPALVPWTFVPASCLLVAAVTLGGPWLVPLVVCSLCVFRLEEGVRLAWVAVVAALLAMFAWVAGWHDAYTPLTLGAVGAWCVAFVVSWPRAEHASR